jgi:thioredoxin-dependent peroxiredoxin
MKNATRRLFLSLGLAALLFGTPLKGADAAKPPAVGDNATDFELKSIAGDKVKLSKTVEDGPVVLMVLRGYPGYQCPLCTKQVAEFIGKAEAIKKAGAKVLLVYPGPSDKLQAKAEEFVKGKDYPENFTLLLDPDYSFTKAYDLRWDAKNETAYPSTFVVDKKMKVTYAKVSKEHGDRAKATDVLKSLAAK